MPRARRTVLLMALLAPLCAALAGRSLLLDAPLPPGETEVERGLQLHRSAAAAADRVAGQLGLACRDTEVFVWPEADLGETAARLETNSRRAGLIYREIHRDFDALVFRALVRGGERLGVWVRLDGAALLAVCSI